MASKLLDKTVSDKVLELDLGKLSIEDLGQLSRRGYGISADDQGTQQIRKSCQCT